MDLAALRAAVNQRTGIAFDTGALNSLVNEAVTTVASEADWPWLNGSEVFLTLAGVTRYPMPTGWTRTRSVSANGNEVRSASIRDLDTFDTRTFDTRSFATHTFTVDEDELVLLPELPVSVTVTHRFVRSEPTLVNDTDVPLLPAHFHPALVAYGSYLVLQRKDEARRAEMCRIDYERWIKRMRDDVSRKRGPVRIRVRDGAGI